MESLKKEIKEVLESVAPYIVEHPYLMDLKVLERIVEPERIIIFRVPWLDDEGEILLFFFVRVLQAEHKQGMSGLAHGLDHGARLFGAEDGRAGNDHVRACLGREGNIVLLDAAVHFNVDRQSAAIGIAAHAVCLINEKKGCGNEE